MPSSEFARIIDQVSREKGISRDVVVKAIEDAIASAARRQIGIENKIEAQYNEELSEVEVFRGWTVVEVIADPTTEIVVNEARQKFDPDAEVGDEFLEKLPAHYGRIAAQAARQNLVQRIRDAEREIIYNEFKDRKEEIINGIVTRFERKNMIVQLRPNVDAILPEKEQIPRERYRPQDRIRAFVLDVEMTMRGPQIVLSRTHPGFLKKLFEAEVPEIYEGIVEIMGVAREPGGRAKIAVTSHDTDVDPVGACVGMRGTRVQSVVQELRGEKIDIVNWTLDPAEFVCRALSPAKVAKIIMDEDERSMEVIVPDDQLSLAIGKKGQNVRLASRLAEWKLDVRSEGEAEDESRRSRASLISIPGVSDVTAELLLQDGYKSAEEVADSNIESLVDVDGIDEARAGHVLAAAREHVATIRKAREEAAQAVAAEEAARVRSFLGALSGVEPGSAEKLIAAGFATLDSLANSPAAEVAQLLSIDKEGAERIRAAARAQLEALLLPPEGSGETGVEGIVA